MTNLEPPHFTRDEVLFVGGRVLTMDKYFTEAEAVVVRQGRICHVGTTREMRGLVSPQAQVIDLGGRTLMPGMVDGHAHMDSWWRNYPSLSGSTSIADIQKRISQLSDRCNPGEWIVLRQLADPEHKAPANLKEGRYPTCMDLDPVSPQNPVWIRGTYSDPSVVNSLALKLAGISRDTPQPTRLEPTRDGRTHDIIPSPGGRIEFDQETGDPTGVLYDFDTLLSQATTHRLAEVLPEPSYEERLENIEGGARDLSALGITAVHEGHGVCNPIDVSTRAYLEAHAKGTLSVRVQLVPNVYTSGSANDIISRIDQLSYAAHAGAGDDWLRFSGIGVTLDGPGGALDSVQQKVADWDGPHDEIRDGICRVPKEKFSLIAREAASRGFRLSTKAGGEKMVDWVLEVYADVDAKWGIKQKRWVMFHSQFTHPRQMAGLRRLGVAPATAANFIWNHGSAYVAGYGRDVAERSVPFGSFLRAGLPIANESDTTPKNPLFAMWIMLTRKDGTTGECLGMAERLDRRQALRVLTTNGSVLLNMEDRIGSIEPGKYADMVVLSEDVLAVDEDRIKDIEVLLTMVGGRVVHMNVEGQSLFV